MIPTIPALPLSHLESGGMTISVIVPAHNAAGYLRHSLPALQRSTYPAFECIVVDDASTDDTAAVCQAFAVQRVGLTGAAHGPATARNRGAAVSRGDILLFLDADVVLRPETLSRLAAAPSAGRPGRRSAGSTSSAIGGPASRTSSWAIA